MKAIIIGAGRGSRLGHHTDEVPKTLVPVLGRPMLDQILEALAFAGFERKDIVFIAGYRADVIRERYPDLQVVLNEGWEHNNILGSLLCAREHLRDGFVSSYADIVYRPEVARAIRTSEHAFALGCDVDWRRRYVRRSHHPESDAEKLLAEGARVVRLSRRIPSEVASGEFIGVMKLDASAAEQLVDAYDRAQARYAGKEFREGRSFEKAYLIDLLEHMIEESATPMHRVDTKGGYMEIDTNQDRELAASWWAHDS